MDPLVLRVSKTLNPSDVTGQMYIPSTRTFEVDITAAGTLNAWRIPAGTFITRVIAQVETALNGSGTFEVGVTGNPDAFIDGADWTETNADAYATNVGSSNADYPNGIYLAAANILLFTAGGSPTQGTVRVWVEYIDFDTIFGSSYGANLSADI